MGIEQASGCDRSKRRRIRYDTAMDHDRLFKEVLTDIPAGERHEVDLLVKTRFRDRREFFFLIHVENQASTAADFSGGAVLV